MEKEEKKELAFNRLQRRKLQRIALITDYINLKKNDDIKPILGFSHSSPSSSSPHFFLRDCTSRVSFNSGSESAIASSTASSINYLLKNEDAEIITSDESVKIQEDNEVKALNLKNIEDAQKFFSGKKILRIMISPEDSNAPLEKCVKNTISYLEEKTGQKLYYVASLHTDTDHLHSHIVISREDGGNCSKKNPLIIDKNTLIKGAREVMQRTISDSMGYLTENEYYEKFEKNIDKLGSARIDYKIEKARETINNSDKRKVKYDEIINGIPLRLKETAKKRIDNLVNFKADDLGIKMVGDEVIFSNLGWQEYLRAKDKSRVFSSVTQSAKVNVDNYIKESHSFTTYYGKVVDKKVLEEDTGKVAFLVKGDDDNEFHYAERKMTYDKYNAIKKGDSVKVSSSSSTLVKTPKGYRKRENIFITKITDDKKALNNKQINNLQNLQNDKLQNLKNNNLQNNKNLNNSNNNDKLGQKNKQDKGIVL